MADDPGSARNLRVSDAEREHVVGLLQRATGSGLLDLDEFTRRVDTALAARTRAELNVVLLDLPGVTHPEQPRQLPLHRPPAAPRPAPAASVDTGSTTEIRSTFGTAVRKGEWDVPARLAVRVQLGSAELDFTAARIPHPEVEIDLDVTAGSVEMRLPEGARVDHNSLYVTLGSVEDRSRRGNGVLFRLVGTVRAGSVELRGPKQRWWRRR
ncbi:hypothetical protein BJF78_15090 [Pseudonocardia sp. CNS-139]|nr:hypothetical protein BJF78_15090 [Pseudonocardia sp. CNS-139]